MDKVNWIKKTFSKSKSQKIIDIIAKIDFAKLSPIAIQAILNTKTWQDKAIELLEAKDYDLFT